MVPVLLVSLMLLPGCLGQEEDEYLAVGESVAVLTEELRIDGYAEDLVPISSIAVSADGTIAMIQQQDALIRFFSRSGEPLGTFGGRGEGPGEFMMPVRLGWHGDTLWVLDRALQRASFVAPSLELARIQSHLPRQTRLGEEAGGGTGVTFFTMLWAPGPEGGLYANVASLGKAPPEPFTEYGTWAYVDSRGIIQTTILPLVADPSSGPLRNEPQSDIAPRVGRGAVASASLDGRLAGTFSLTTVDMEGDTVFTRRYAFEREEIPDEVADRLLVEYAGERTAATGQTWAGGEVPRMYPPFQGLLIGEDGSIWIRTRLRDRERPYYVLAADGEPLGTVNLAEGGGIAAATLDRIWVIDRDSLGVQSVVRYGVEWN